jgi:hypothetical protein
VNASSDPRLFIYITTTPHTTPSLECILGYISGQSCSITCNPFGICLIMSNRIVKRPCVGVLSPNTRGPGRSIAENLNGKLGANTGQTHQIGFVPSSSTPSRRGGQLGPPPFPCLTTVGRRPFGLCDVGPQPPESYTGCCRRTSLGHARLL